MEPVERCAAKQSLPQNQWQLNGVPKSGKSEGGHRKIRVARRPEHSNTQCSRRAVRNMTKTLIPEAHRGHRALPLH